MSWDLVGDDEIREYREQRAERAQLEHARRPVTLAERADAFPLRAVATVQDALDRALGEARSRAAHPSTVREQAEEAAARWRHERETACLHGAECDVWPYCPTTGSDAA